MWLGCLSFEIPVILDVCTRSREFRRAAEEGRTVALPYAICWDTPAEDSPTHAVTPHCSSTNTNYSRSSVLSPSRGPPVYSHKHPSPARMIPSSIGTTLSDQQLQCQPLLFRHLRGHAPRSLIGCILGLSPCRTRTPTLWSRFYAPRLLTRMADHDALHARRVCSNGLRRVPDGFPRSVV